MPDRKTLSTQVDPESELFKEFVEYEQEYSSRSEAIRAALRDGMADDAITREEFEQALVAQRREAQIGSWESAALTCATLLASVAIAVAVLTILPFVPSFEGMATATILVATAGVLAYGVIQGSVERLERRFSTPAASDGVVQRLAEVPE
jgi:Arc/MetJ-type ribon-helix-helix transcriptional regulator